VSLNECEFPRGPGFWKFNNSMLSDTNYVELLTFKIPMFAKKHEQVNNKGLYWKMSKMEICAFTIAFSKKKATRKSDEESILLSEMTRLQTKLQTSYIDSLSLYSTISTKLLVCHMSQSYCYSNNLSRIIHSKCMFSQYMYLLVLVYEKHLSVLGYVETCIVITISFRFQEVNYSTQFSNYYLSFNNFL